MLDAGRQWELFGYDMRNVGRHWVSAWRDFLWAYDSPVRRHLDEAVLLRDGPVEQTYHAGEPCAATATACSAILLPDDLVLARRLQLPIAVEADLDAVLTLEVTASSPFGAEDTASGWRVVERREKHLDILLVIVSKSAAMTHIARHYDSHDAQAQEVWARVDDVALVVAGFGEQRRAGFYRRRLLRVAGMIALAGVLLLFLAGLAAGMKSLELSRVEASAARIESEAQQASLHRATLGQGNEVIAEINALAALYPSPHPEIARLTRLLGDDAYIERFSMTGQELDLRGRARNAAQMMQKLSEQPGYSEVAAASPIRRIPNSDVEQFHLKIKLEGEA